MRYLADESIERRIVDALRSAGHEVDFTKAKRGAVIPQTGKSRISIYLDDKVLEEFRARGCSRWGLPDEDQ